MSGTEDAVNHPNHYNQYSGFEVIDVCEQLVGPDGKSGFNLGNAFKYIARAGWKNPDKQVEDLEKAKFYIQREIDRVSRDNEDPFDSLTTMMGVLSHCPDCGVSLVKNKDLHDECPQGHGWVRVPRDGSHNVWVACQPDAAQKLRCPACNLVLLSTNACPDGHGWMTIDSTNDHFRWMPPSTFHKNPLLTGVCPECGIQLVRKKGYNPHCPQDHGWVSFAKTLDGAWIPQDQPESEEKPKSGLPQCPRCGVVLALGEGDTRFCLDGHGRMSSVKETTPGVWNGVWTDDSDSVLRRGIVEIP